MIVQIKAFFALPRKSTRQASTGPAPYHRTFSYIPELSTIPFSLTGEAPQVILPGEQVHHAGETPGYKVPARAGITLLARKDGKEDSVFPRADRVVGQPIPACTQERDPVLRLLVRNLEQTLAAIRVPPQPHHMEQRTKLRIGGSL